MTDDTGFGVSSTFGGVIPTPTLDRIAANGPRYTNFNSTVLWSPSRAALITGRNHHSMGFGVVSEVSTSYLGYNRVMSRDKATIAGSSTTMATAHPGSARITTLRRSRPARPARSTIGPPAWASTTFTASWAVTPASGSRTCSTTQRL
jgi:hypothetical protein